MKNPIAVVRSEWGKNLHDLRPLYAERTGRTRVGPVPAPADPKGFTEYGFDERARLLETRAHRGRGRVDVDRDRHGEDFIEVEHVPSTLGHPVTHSRYELRDGRVVAWRWETPAGRVEEAYRYEGERVVEVRSVGPNDPPRVARVTWSPEGDVRITSRSEDSGRVVEVYDGAASTPVREDELELLLFDAIVARVASFADEGTAYALLLVEGDGAEAIPPELTVGLARAREAWLAGVVDPVDRLWSPEDVSRFAGPRSFLDDAAVREASEAFRRALRATDRPGAAHALNVRLAKRLNEVRARLAISQTDDFVVVLVSLDGGLRVSELDRYLSPEQLARLRERGWI